ncbi:DUF485 domain-containing protein [Kroppenstedtia pulmonis]|nr:DUF485 domain-containing protein [Kroppenstedtia pulmonis]
MAQSHLPKETDDSAHTDWTKLAQSQIFEEMMRRKKRFVFSATMFFLVYYFSLPILNGYTDWLNIQVIGSINLVYLFALSQIIMAWVLAVLYIRHANQMDRHVKAIGHDGKEDSP